MYYQFFDNDNGIGVLVPKPPLTGSWVKDQKGTFCHSPTSSCSLTTISDLTLFILQSKSPTQFASEHPLRRQTSHKNFIEHLQCTIQHPTRYLNQNIAFKDPDDFDITFEELDSRLPFNIIFKPNFALENLNTKDLWFLREE